MPYLPVDLDAKRRAAMIEASLQLPRHAAIGGLLELWEYVWREKRDVVTPLYLGACLGPDERIVGAFVESGFLEPVEGGYRVRGAAKWLFGMEGKKRGGQAAKSNLIPGARQKKAAEKQPRESEGPAHILSAPAESQPRASRDPLSAHISALTPSIQHPASKNLLAGEKQPAPKKPKAERPPNPRHAPMVKALVDAAPGYSFQPRDAKAVADLLALGTDAEILAHWKRARSRTGYPLVRTLPELVQHWEHFREDDAKPAAREEPSCRLL